MRSCQSDAVGDGEDRCRERLPAKGRQQGTPAGDPSPYKQFGIRAHLHNGRLTLYLEPVEEAVSVGDTFVLADDSMPQPVEDTLTARIVEIGEAKGEAANGISEFLDDFRRMAARGAASTVLALAAAQDVE
jgi:hypothetical protein